MDRYAVILASLPHLKGRLRRAGVGQWLKEQPTVEVEGHRYFVLGGDRLASKPEAMLTFALERGLVDARAVEAAASRQPLEPGVETIEIGTEEQGDS